MLAGTEPIKTRDGDSKRAILDEALERARRAHSHWSDNYTASRREVSFLAGDQWPAGVAKERAAENRPALTINTLPTFIDQVQGDQRMARPAISVHPADDGDEELLDREDQTIRRSMLFEGLIRNIEYESGAEMHYDQAFQHALEGGFGWLRVLTEYAHKASFDQDIRIRHVRNRWAVLLDPESEEPDGSDANFGFIRAKMNRKEFEKRYPKAAGGEIAGDGIWGDGDSVVVAEYFRREPTTRTLVRMSDGATHWHDEIEAVVDDMASDGVTEVMRREVKTHKVVWCKITGGEILEPDREWPGSTIPIVPVFGKWIDLEDGPEYRGLTRNATDAKSMHNLMMSSAAERIGKAPLAPFFATPDQIDGHEGMWSKLNTGTAAYLLYNQDPDKPMAQPYRIDQSPMPAAELQMALNMNDLVKGTIGIYDASLGARSNETSGKAIMARQREGDVGSFAFVDNLNRAIARVGKICVEIIPKIYDAERVVMVRNIDDTSQLVEINKTVRDAETGEDVLVNDIARGRYSVVVKSGPSYTTQRMEATEALMQFVQAAPNTAPVLLDVLAASMDWPHAQRVAERLRKMVPPHLLTAKERQAMKSDGEDDIVQPEPTPEQQAAQAGAQADIAQAKAVQAKAQADLAIQELRTQEAQLKLQAVMASGGDDDDRIRQIVAEAIADIYSRGTEQNDE